MLPEQRDKKLLELTLKDRKHFAHIYNKYFDKIYKYCNLKLNFRREETEDAVSQIFVSALTNIEKVNIEENGTLLPWLYTIARNQVYGMYRKKSSISVDEEVIYSAPDRDLGFEKEIENSNSEDYIKEILAELDQESIDICFLKIYEDMKFNQIAQQLDLKESAVKMRYYRAIEYVNKRMYER